MADLPRRNPNPFVWIRSRLIEQNHPNPAQANQVVPAPYAPQYQRRQNAAQPPSPTKGDCSKAKSWMKRMADKYHLKKQQRKRDKPFDDGTSDFTLAKKEKKLFQKERERTEALKRGKDKGQMRKMREEMREDLLEES